MHRRDVIVTILIVTFASLAVQGAATKANDNFEQFGTLAVVIEKVRDNYVEEVNEKQLFEGAIRGALSSLDRYSSYISPEDLEEFKTQTKGEFQGLGIEIGLRNNWLTVISPIEDTPAWRAGVRSGDRIVKIEGKSTEKMTTDQAVKVLRGKKGTSVKLTIRHEGETKDLDLSITRDVIPIISVRGYKRVDKDAHWEYFVDPKMKIAYVRITAFQEKTLEELDKAIAELQEKGMKGLVLDLRFDPGGLLSTAVNICDRFIDEGIIVSTRGRAVEPVVYKAHKAGTYPDFPLAVLINNWSASASEILAGCIQDHHRGVLVGEQSFGKGSVQNVIPLQGEKAALKLTTAHYYTPSGRCIQREEGSEVGGLTPDILVVTDVPTKVKIQQLWQKLGTPPTPEELKAVEDKEPKAEPAPVEEPAPDDGMDNGNGNGNVKPKKPAEFKDEQLNSAVDAVKTLIIIKETPAADVAAPAPVRKTEPAVN